MGALFWWTKAAEQGDVDSQSNLGVLLKDGAEGVAKSASGTLKWWTKAAKKGHAKAQYNLGLLLAEGGEGVPKDASAAEQWYKKAAAGGDKDAKDKLREYGHFAKKLRMYFLSFS